MLFAIDPICYKMYSKVQVIYILNFFFIMSYKMSLISFQKVLEQEKIIQAQLIVVILVFGIIGAVSLNKFILLLLRHYFLSAIYRKHTSLNYHLSGWSTISCLVK